MGRCGARVRALNERDAWLRRGRFAISDEITCSHQGDCWSISNLFAHWNGRVLSAELRFPMSRCEAYGFAVPCLHAAPDVATHWHSGEYWRQSSLNVIAETSCLALPDIACSKPSAQKRSLSWNNDRVHGLVHNQRLL